MRADQSTRSWLWVLLAVCAISGLATALATWRYGVGLTPDSFVYLNGARSLATGFGYTSDGSPISAFAPGYSAVLSLGEHIGVPVGTGARVLAVACFVSTVLLGYVLLRRHVRSPKIVAAATVAIGCSAVLLQTFEEALSEHVFIIVVLLFVLVAERLMESPRALIPPATLVVLAWAAFYLRYAGLVFVGVSVLVVVLATWRLGSRQAIVRGSAVFLAGVALPAVWMRRNIRMGAGLLGSRQEAAASPLTNVSRTARELGGWLSTEWAPTLVQVAFFVVAFVVLVGVVLLIVDRRASLPPSTREMVPLILVITIYLAYLTITASLVAFAAINTRFMSPVFVPLVVLGAWAFEQARLQLHGTARKWLSAAGVAWLVISVLAFGVEMTAAARDGAGGYASKRWHDSALIADIKHLDRSVPLYTNDSVGVELFTRRVVPLSVAKTFFASNQETGNLPKFLHDVRCAGHVQLAWFLPNSRPRLYEPAELADHLRVVPVIKRGDGVLYDLAPMPGDPRPTGCPSKPGG